MTTNAFRFRVEMSDRVLPSTNIFAGGTFPAAVICPWKMAEEMRTCRHADIIQWKIVEEIVFYFSYFLHFFHSSPLSSTMTSYSGHIIIFPLHHMN